MNLPKATIVFTTHNRCDTLSQAIEFALRQDAEIEIIVMDDGSTDGTADMMARRYAEIQYLRTETARGPCYQRNRGIERAKTDIVLPLDDDTMLVSPKTVRQVLAEFATNERLGVVAMPFINILQDGIVRQRGSGAPADRRTCNFVACAHAVRKQALIEVGGYTELLYYMGEEGDLSIRLLESEWDIIRGQADPAHHLQPAGRRSLNADFFGRRNDVLFHYMHAPNTSLLSRLVGTVVKGLIFGVRNQCLKATIRGFNDALNTIVAGHVQRRPKTPRLYRRFLLDRA